MKRLSGGMGRRGRMSSLHQHLTVNSERAEPTTLKSRRTFGFLKKKKKKDEF